jgi:oligopeptide/dipeptide ABC transporter ATP-binding protein
MTGALPAPEGPTVLDVSDLRVAFRTPAGLSRAVDGISFCVQAARVLGIVGESGSGKSVTAQALLGLRRTNRFTEVSGSVLFEGQDVLRMSERQLQRVRGRKVAMVFQDPMTSLNPLIRIGDQIGEMLSLHTDLSRSKIRERVTELLAEVGIPSPRQRAQDYPHQLSGGMRQRVTIAMAVACNPSVIIADEPTTALDVTIQAQILELLDRLRVNHGTAIVFITHDLGVVADLADDVVVMYAGRVVEQASKQEIFSAPQHPYTWGLLDSIPRVDRPPVRRLVPIPGAPPSSLAVPEGCVFAPRCAYAFASCAVEPTLAERAGRAGHLDRCWLPPERRTRQAREDAAA